MAKATKMPAEWEGAYERPALLVRPDNWEEDIPEGVHVCMFAVAPDSVSMAKVLSMLTLMGVHHSVEDLYAPKEGRDGWLVVIYSLPDEIGFLLDHEESRLIPDAPGYTGGYLTPFLPEFLDREIREANHDIETGATLN